ncbi:hypothetical protein MAAFP003_2371 [Mycobacterium ahvazicum]|uniref:Uncharacterized protein n=1 Tax=Mycobacterium ahvazicum TaxID=1964395 RepID=A0A2K4YAC8_9MYCO|nr:hypothetical protein [Mycobacterium ahvazicum]SOX53697.1 hypothetical protein MAAFP003_2371 [Mycobacterium ahvazicum]
MTTWRDLTDQLTADQIQELEHMESAADYDGTLGPDEEMLSRARRYARDNLIAGMVGDVALPSGATWADVWQEDDPQPHRVIFGASSTISDGKTCVLTDAIQFADGKIDSAGNPPSIAISYANTDTGIRLDSARAREFAAVLSEAADQIDRWQ